MIPRRIREVLSTTAEHRLGALLTGGRACVFYGAAEFSRDTHLLILPDAADAAALERVVDIERQTVVAGLRRDTTF